MGVFVSCHRGATRSCPGSGFILLLLKFFFTFSPLKWGLDLVLKG